MFIIKQVCIMNIHVAYELCKNAQFVWQLYFMPYVIAQSVYTLISTCSKFYWSVLIITYPIIMHSLILNRHKNLVIYSRLLSPARKLWCHVFCTIHKDADLIICKWTSQYKTLNINSQPKDLTCRLYISSSLQVPTKKKEKEKKNCIFPG